MARVLLTYEDLQQMPEDELHTYELLEGELIVNPAPNLGHQHSTLRLAAILLDHCDRHALGTVLSAPCDVRLSNVNVLEPDILFVRREREAILGEQYVDGPPDLVVEVLSPRTARRDQGAKRELYARFAVPHYWQVDPGRHEIVALALEAGAYREVGRASGDESFSAPPFPDLAISLARLWR